VYVADTGNQRVQVFDLDGTFIGKFGTPADPIPLPDQFSNPRDVAVTENDIFVCDYLDYTVKRFSKTAPYAFIDEIGGGYSADPGSFKTPVSICADVVGNVYVADNGSRAVHKLSGNGEFLSRFGSLGTDDNQFCYPISIAVDGKGALFVADNTNNRISVFAPENGTSTAVSANVTAPAYGGSVKLTVWLRDADGGAIAGEALTLKRSYDGKAWSSLGGVSSSATGTPVPVSGITKKVWYRAEFAGAHFYAPASTRTATVIAPKVKALTTPKAPSSAKKGSSFTVYGYLEPKHTAGAHSVRILKYRKSGGEWVYKGYTNAHNYTSGSKTTYIATVKLTSTGVWKLQAYAPADSLHAATYSAGYDTITIK